MQPQPCSPAAAGVVLAGGRSSRMGEPKVGLAWHGSTFLYRTSALLARTVRGPVVVVAAPGQALPALPAGVRVVRDPVEGRGPMQGIAEGLRAVASEATVAFVSSTDMPLLHPAFIRRVLRELADAEIDMVLPVARGFRQPLAAGYRTGLAPLITRLLEAGTLTPGMLSRRCRTARLDEASLLTDATLARADPELDSVVNVNTRADYERALRKPPALIEVSLSAAGVTVPEPRSLRAATVAEAASGVGLRLGQEVTITLNGAAIALDDQIPLVAGDRVTFRFLTGTQ